jgi:signal transduction histidine kinase
MNETGPRPAPSGTGGDFLDLAEVFRMAVAALRADGLLVVDERGAEPTVVIAEGLTPTELSEALDAMPGPPDALGKAGVEAGTLGHRQVLSAALCLESGPRFGSLRVVYDPGTTPPADVRMLVLAFARHIGFALARGTARTPDEARRAVGVSWESLERLPDAINEITAQVTEVVRPLTGATDVGITIWDEEREILRALPGAFGATDDTLVASVTGPATNMFSTGSRVFSTGQPYLSNDPASDPGILRAYVEKFRIRRILSVPLDCGDRRIGVLHLVNKPSDFTTDDVAAVEAVTPQIAIMVDLARAVVRLVARQRLERILTGAAMAIASGKPAADCLLPAFDDLGAVIGASVVALFPRDFPPLIRRTGPEDPELERRLAADARQLGSRSVGAYPQVPGDPGWAALHAPVELYGERTATLSVLRRTGEPFVKEEQDVVARLASLVALAWATERYQHQLAEIARLRERERIADALHDRVAQILYAAQLGIDTVVETAPASPEAARMIEVRELLIRGDTAIRDVIEQLTATAGEPSLARRVRLEVEAVEEEFGVAVHLELPADDELRDVSRPVADAVVRVAREGIVNAAKHAGPCRIAINIGFSDDRIVMSIVDDGLGVGGAEGHTPGHGLRSLHRQVEDAGGTLAVAPGSGGFGTRLVATFPV